MRELDVGLLGAGGIGDRHARSIDAAADARLIAVCDLDAERARGLAEPRGAAVYTDFDTFMAAEGRRLDALFICIPSFARNLSHVERPAQAGIHLFVEKPLTLSLPLARQMWDVIQRAGIIHSSGYMWRYHPITEEARGLIGDRRLALAEGRMLSNSAVHLAGTWFTEQGRSGGQIVDQSTHVIDALRYLVGEITRLCGWGKRFRTDLAGDVLDHSVIALEYDNGCIGSMTSSWVTPTWEALIRLVGEDLDITVDYGNHQIYGKIDGGDIHIPRQGDPYVDEVEAFFQAIRSDDMGPIRSPFDDALRTLAVTLAANESIEAGERRAPHLESW